MHQPIAARRRTAIALAALTAALATAAPAIVAAPAHGQLWMQVSCVNPDRSAAPSDGWTGGSTGTVSIGSTNNTNCSPTVPMYAGLSMQSPAPTGASEYLAYTPPSGSTLVGGSLLVGLQANGYGYRAVAWASMFTPAYQYDASNVFLQCVAVLAACQNGLPEYYGTVNLPANKGGNLYLGAGCMGQIAGTYCTNGGSRSVWSSVAVASANLLLSTSSLPTASDFAGSLLTLGAHGNATLTFTAADSGPGVLRATVSIDSTVVYSATPSTNAGKCVPVGTDPGSGALMFNWQQPCARSQSVIVPVDTTKLADGEHALKVTLQNAAGNASTVLARTITTNNLTTISGKLTSDAPAPPPTPEPEYAIELDPATRALARGTRRAFRRSALTLSGTLRTSAGVPAPGVRVTLSAQNGGQGDRVVVARSSSDPSGHWVLRAPKGPTRVLRITYGSGTRGAVTIKQAVGPAVTLTVRSLGHGRVRFTGRLRIAPLGSPLPFVVIQARKGSKWQSVGQNVRVSASGAYVLTFSDQRAKGTFRFRALAPATRLFTTAISPIRKVVVR